MRESESESETETKRDKERDREREREQDRNIVYTLVIERYHQKDLQGANMTYIKVKKASFKK